MWDSRLARNLSSQWDWTVPQRQSTVSPGGHGSSGAEMVRISDSLLNSRLVNELARSERAKR